MSSWSSPPANITVLFTTDTSASPQWFIYNPNGTPLPLILTTNNGVLQTTGIHSNSYLVNLQVRGILSGYSPGSITNASYYIYPPPTTSSSTYYPLARIDFPEDGSVITGPTIIKGIAMLNTNDMTDTFGTWLLEYRLADGTGAWTSFGSDTNFVGGTRDTNFNHPFDPTVLLDGLYDIRLTVADTNGDTSIYKIQVLVQGKQKVGNFTISFVDLSVPVAGVPLQVTRTYDSRDKGQGDFGIGWRLSVNSVQIQQSGTMGANWEQVEYSGGFLETFLLQETASHLITITFPGDQVYSFEATLDANFNEVLPIEGGTVVYNPLPGTQATLTATGDNYVDLSETTGAVTFLMSDGITTYDPYEFQLTTRDGRVFLISTNSGLESITDLNGNVISFDASGIYKSTTASEGTVTNIVSYARETGGLHRITDIYLTSDGTNNAIHYAYGTSGGSDALNLLQVTDRSTNTTTFAYDSMHYLTDIVNPAGNHAVQTTYDSNGRITQTVDAQNNVTKFDYSDLGDKHEKITDALENINDIYYDNNGNVTLSIKYLPDIDLGYIAVTNLYQFADPNNPNKPTMTVDPLGRTNVMRYSPSGDLLSITDPMTNTTTYTYNGFGQVTSIIDARGVLTVQNQYDNYGNLMSSTDALDASTTSAYNPDGTLASTTDANNNVTRYYYGATGADPGGTGQPTSVYDANNHLTEHKYDSAGNRTNTVTTRTLINGTIETLTSAYFYDNNSRITNTVINGQSQGQSFYNDLGKLDHTLDANNGPTSYVYDETGRLTQTITLDGLTNSTVYDALGRQINAIDKAGHITQTVYDALGRQAAMIYSDGTSTTNQYDLAGQLKTATDANGNPTQYEYDGAGRRTRVTDALGHSMTYEYDEIGNQVSVTDAKNNQTLSEYDDAGRLTTTTFQDNTTQTTTFDVLGRKIAQTDQATNTTQFGYDALGRLTSVTNALTYVTTYGYDEVGNQTNQVDALNHQTTFEYDALGRRTKRTLPGTQFETFAYDAVGNRLSHTDFNGLVITNNYDAMNRLLARWHEATQLETNIYNSLGELTSRTDTSGNYSWVYDARGRVTTNTTPVGTLYYGYDANGNQTRLGSATSGGVTNQYQYDALNRLTNVVDNGLSGANNTAYTYDPVGNLQTLNYPNNVSNLWQYDSLNRLTNLVASNSTALASFYYKLGPTGNRTNLSETIGSTNRNFAWGYDNLYRLTSEITTASTSTDTLNYGYDYVGNRLTRANGGFSLTNQTFTFNSNDWLNGDSYDSDGNTTGSSGVTYQYDYANRLTNNGSVYIIYDADGNRISKKVGSTTTLYLVSTINPTGYPQVVEEFTVSGTTTNLKVYTYGLSLINQRVPATSTNFFGMDGHGSTRFLTDIGGNVANVFAYDAYGNLIASNSAPQTAYLYSGEQWDSDLGMYYNRSRYMNPGTGRFWTMDTFEGIPFEPLTLHKYLFVAANPINKIDPSGHEGDAISMGGTLTIGGGLQGLSLPALNAARVWAMVQIGASALATGAVLSLSGDDATNGVSAMRLQLQEGSNKHYWSDTMTAGQAGVTRNQVQRNLGAMFEAVQLQDALRDDWDKFPFSRWESQLMSAIITMSARLNTFGPVDASQPGQAGNVMRQLLNPTDPSDPRIDLENLRGVNLRR